MVRFIVMAGMAIGLGLGLRADSAGGQDPAPESIVDSAMVRLAGKDWAGFARYMHPSTLQEFKFYVMKITQIREQTGVNDPRFNLIFGRPTLAEVNEAPADILFTNFLRAAETIPEFGRILSQTEYERLGVVDEGPEYKHVVVRHTYAFDDNIARRIEVITLQKDGESWKMLLPSNIENFINELGWPKLQE